MSVEGQVEVQKVAEVSLDDNFKTVLEGISQLNSQSRDLQNQVKELVKRVKVASKPKKVKKHTVMHDPVCVSKELRCYLGIGEDENHTMASCMKLVSQKIKDDSLQVKDNLRTFKPDKKLGKVLNMSPIKVITFVELNKYLRHHYTPM